MRVFASRLYHETNCFAPGSVGLDSFLHRHGATVLEARGDGSVLGAALGWAARSGWEVMPSFDLSANPGPITEDEVIETALRHVDDDLPRALREGLDGVFLVLHGAMVSRSHLDAEGILLARVREHLHGTGVPTAAVLDLHANVSPAMAANADILVAYRCNPHTDAAETGVRAAALLDRAMRKGIHYRTHLCKLPVLLPPTGTGTAEEPMRGLLSIARNHERDLVTAVSVCPGFAHADTPFTGMTFQIVAEDSPAGNAAAQRAEEDLADYAMVNAAAGLRWEWKLAEAVRDAVRRDEYPALIVEPADNIGGGTAGDATWVMDEFLRQRVRNAGVVLNAPEAVLSLRDVPAGQRATVTVGGKNPELAGPALKLEVEIVRHSEGVFDLEDRQSHLASMIGSRIDMGRSVLVDCQGNLLLLTSRATPPMDLGQWLCVGVRPEQLGLIGIKAAVAHRRAYDTISRRSYTVSTPGPCTSNLSSLPYRHLTRPVFPLDPLPAIRPSGTSSTKRPRIVTDPLIR